VQIFCIIVAGKFFKISPKPLYLYFNKTSFIFYINSRVDVAALEEIFAKKEYGFAYAEALGKMPSVILDLGANIGDSSVFYATLFPEAKIYAIEPNPLVHDKLQLNTAAFKNIQIRKCAIGNKTQKITFYLGASHLGSSLKKRQQNTKEIEVGLVALTDFLAAEGLQHVDILKFDIEGGEEDLLKDVAMKDKVGVFIGEMHDDLTSVPTRGLVENIPAEILQVCTLTPTRNITVARSV
jgi:FkbM family methyltransferase